MKKLISVIFGFLLVLPMVSAQNSGLPIPDILTTLIETLFRGDVDDAYQRLLIFILAFTIFYAGLQVSPFGAKSTGKSGISITIGLILAAIATLSMPQTLLNTLFGMYSGIFGVILLFGPALAILIFVFKNFRGQDAGTYIAQGLILAIVGLMLMSKEVLANVPILETIGAIGYVEFTGMIILIVAIVYLGKAIGALRSDTKLTTSNITNPGGLLSSFKKDEADPADKEAAESIANSLGELEETDKKESELEKSEKNATDIIDKDATKLEENAANLGQTGDTNRELKNIRNSMATLLNDYRKFHNPKEESNLISKELEIINKLESAVNTNIKTITQRIEKSSKFNSTMKDKSSNEFKGREKMIKYLKEKVLSEKKEVLKYVEELKSLLENALKLVNEEINKYDALTKSVIAQRNEIEQLSNNIRNENNPVKQREYLSNFKSAFSEESKQTRELADNFKKINENINKNRERINVIKNKIINTADGQIKRILGKHKI